MSGAERRMLRERIISYMEYHPRAGAVSSKAQRSAPATTGLLGLSRSHLFYLRRASAAFAVVVLVALPVAAERALPGDVLYPVKVRFNEELRGTLNNTPYEALAWETERLERRLAEARLLSDAGKLTPETEAAVAAAVKTHSEAAQQKIDSIRIADSDEAAIAEIALSSTLDVQSEMLEGHSAALAEAVDEAREVAIGARTENRPSYERLAAHIELESTRAYELLNTVAGDASEDVRRDIERRLDAVREQMEQAAALKEDEAEDTGEAVALLSAALADTRKAIAFMTDLDVRAHVSIEELIPIDDEAADERRIKLEERLEEVYALQAEIDAADLTDASEDLRAAIEAGIRDIEAASDAAEAALADEALDEADTESAAALEAAVAVMSLLGLTETATATSSSTDPEQATTTE